MLLELSVRSAGSEFHIAKMLYLSRLLTLRRVLSTNTTISDWTTVGLITNQLYKSSQILAVRKHCALVEWIGLQHIIIMFLPFLSLHLNLCILLNNCRVDKVNCL